MKTFHKWYSDLKLFLDSEELGDYISKNIKDINLNNKKKKKIKIKIKKKKIKSFMNSITRIIILNSLEVYTKKSIQ